MQLPTQHWWGCEANSPQAAMWEDSKLLIWKISVSWMCECVSTNHTKRWRVFLPVPPEFARIWRPKPKTHLWCVWRWAAQGRETDKRHGLWWGQGACVCVCVCVCVWGARGPSPAPQHCRTLPLSQGAWLDPDSGGNTMSGRFFLPSGFWWRIAWGGWSVFGAGGSASRPGKNTVTMEMSPRHLKQVNSKKHRGQQDVLPPQKEGSGIAPLLWICWVSHRTLEQLRAPQGFVGDCGVCSLSPDEGGPECGSCALPTPTVMGPQEHIHSSGHQKPQDPGC